MEEQSFFQKFLRSPFTLIGGSILFLMILHNIWGITERLLSFYYEKRGLETKIAELQKRNEDIKKEINYTETEGFLEREGKARLNLKKPGEEVAVIVEEEEVMRVEGVEQDFWNKMFSSVLSLLKF